MIGIAANSNDRERVELDAGDDGAPVRVTVTADGWLVLADDQGDQVIVISPGQAEQLQRLLERVRT